MTDLFEVADLLVRCSGVPLGRVAAALGFPEPESFSQWFEERGGQHPETARATWASFAAAAPEKKSPDLHEQRCLPQVRRALATALETPAKASLVRAMRSRKPLPAPEPDDRR